jgi:hypothetical protein
MAGPMGSPVGVQAKYSVRTVMTTIVAALASQGLVWEQVTRAEDEVATA